jgi:hypothetical protein
MKQLPRPVISPWQPSQPSLPQDDERERGQQENHTAVTNLLDQVESCLHRIRGGEVSSGGKRRIQRGQSPRRRGAKVNALAVSLDPTSIYAIHHSANSNSSRNSSAMNSTISLRRARPMAARLNLLGFPGF